MPTIYPSCWTPTSPYLRTAASTAECKKIWSNPKNAFLRNECLFQKIHIAFGFYYKQRPSMRVCFTRRQHDEKLEKRLWCCDTPQKKYGSQSMFLDKVWTRVFQKLGMTQAKESYNLCFSTINFILKEIKVLNSKSCFKCRRLLFIQIIPYNPLKKLVAFQFFKTSTWLTSKTKFRINGLQNI